MISIIIDGPTELNIENGGLFLDLVPNGSLSGIKSNWTIILPFTSECELESGVPVRPLPAGSGGRAHRGLLGRDVGRHVQALLEGERRLDLLMKKFGVSIHGS